jgi:hypothetical protein
MGKSDPKKLILAKAELKRAMRASDPKRIARATARVVIADPATMDIFFCHVKLIPLFIKLLKDPRFRPFNTWILETIIEMELGKIEQKYKIQLLPHHKEMIVSVFVKTLKKLWKQSQKNNKRKNKRR